MKFLPRDSDQHVRGNGAPDLRPDRVLAVADESLDAKVLFDPFEEELDTPPALVERGDRQRCQRRVVGQEDQCLAGWVFRFNVTGDSGNVTDDSV